MKNLIVAIKKAVLEANGTGGTPDFRSAHKRMCEGRIDPGCSHLCARNQKPGVPRVPLGTDSTSEGSGVAKSTGQVTCPVGVPYGTHRPRHHCALRPAAPLCSNCPLCGNATFCATAALYGTFLPPWHESHEVGWADLHLLGVIP